MKYVKFIDDLTKGHKLAYVVVIILMAVLAFSRSIVPQFVSYAIDNILDTDPATNTDFVPLFENIINNYDTQLTQIFALSVILAVFQAIRAIFFYARTGLASSIAEKVIYNLREKVYSHMQNLPFTYYKQNNSGDLIQRVTTDIDVIRTFFTSDIIQFVWITFLVIATLYQTITTSAIYTLVVCIPLPFIFIVSFYYSKKIQKEYYLIDHNEGEMTDAIKENITNVEVVKAFGSQEFEYEKYLKRSKPYYVELEKFFNYLARMEAITVFLKTSQIILVLGFGIILYEQGTIGTGTIVSFSLYIGLLSNPIKTLGRLLTRIGRLEVAIDRVEDILEAPEEELELLTRSIDGDITFQNVSYQFEDDSVATIKDISFTIKKGSKVAIMGRTGSGKSTIINLLTRLYDVNSGIIKIGGQDISQINKRYLRSQIGTIVQEPYIFSRNIYENIGISEEDYEMRSIVEHAQAASIHDDIEGFKHGYETIVGEKGTTLSGGQKQRIAIARTLYAGQNILIFDDSLSAVDNETDRNIRKSLEKHQDLTIITVTHKIQSILDYDQVIVLDNGYVVQNGEISQLLNEDGYFKELYAKQIGGE